MAVDDTTTADDTTIESEVPAEVENETSEKDVDLEDIEVSPEELGDESKDEPEEESETESEQEADEPEAETEEVDAEEESEPELSDEEKQKQHNKEMAEKRIQEKQERDAAIKKQQEEYITEGEDPRDTALRQLQVDAYNTKVEGNTNKLTNGYQQAVKDFDILNSSDEAIKAEVDSALDAFQAQYVTLDQYGNPTEVRGDLYEFLKTKADSIERLTGIGARQQEKSKSKEKSKTLITPTRSPKEPKVDPDLAAFEEEADRW